MLFVSVPAVLELGTIVFVAILAALELEGIVSLSIPVALELGTTVLVSIAGIRDKRIIVPEASTLSVDPVQSAHAVRRLGSEAIPSARL